MANWFGRLFRKSPQDEVRNTPTALDWWLTNVIGVDNDEINITPMTSLGVSSVYSAVRIISGTLGSVALNTYEDKGDLQRFANEHDQYYLLRREPHRLYSSTAFIQTLIANYLIGGNGYAEIKRNKFGRPIRYRLLRWDQVEVEWGDSYERIRYKVMEDDGEVRYIPQRDMIHISDMNIDGVQGLSKLELAAEAIGVQLYGNRFANNFYKNGSHIGGWLEFQGTLKDEDLEKLRKTWKSVNGGLNNTGEVAVVDKGTKYNPHTVTMPLSDMEFVESQKFQVVEIARIFNIPVHKINSMDKSSFTNIEQQNIEFIENCIRPIATLLEQEINRKVFRPSEKGRYYVKFELKELLRGDIEAQTSHVTAMIDRSMMSIDEGRSFFGLNPIEDGDTRLAPLNFTTLDKIVKDEPIQESVQSGSEDDPDNGE